MLQNTLDRLEPCKNGVKNIRPHATQRHPTSANPAPPNPTSPPPPPATQPPPSHKENKIGDLLALGNVLTRTAEGEKVCFFTTIGSRYSVTGNLQTCMRLLFLGNSFHRGTCSKLYLELRSPRKLNDWGLPRILQLLSKSETCMVLLASLFPKPLALLASLARP